MKAVILAAGKGERLQPLTDYKPKAMLPVCNKPLIQYQIEQLKGEVEEIGVVVGYLGEEVKHIKDVNFYRDEEIKGTASALYSVRNFVDDEFILIYGDIFFDGNIDEILETPNSIAVVHLKDVGKVVFKQGRLEGIIEKCERGEGFVNAGIYNLDTSIFEFVERVKESERGEYELTDAIMMLNADKGVRVIPFEGYWKDIGYPWDYIDVNMYMLDKIGYSIGEDTEIWSNATIRKPAVIGNDCEIKNCVIERSVIGNNCVIGEFSVVKRSIVMDNSNVPHLNLSLIHI